MKKLFLLTIITFFIFSCGDDKDCTATSCGKGKVCNEKTKECEPKQEEDCTVTSCEAGKVCNENTKRCEPKQEEDCTVTSCEAGQVCNENTKKCEPKQEEDCTVTSCEAGEVCNENTKKCEPKQEEKCSYGTYDESSDKCIANKDSISEVAITGLYPNDMILHNNNLYIVNSGDNAIQKIDLSSNTSTNPYISIGTNNNPYGIFLRDDIFYISNQSSDSFSIFNIDGSEVKNIIKFESENALSAPQAITVDDNNIYIASTSYKWPNFGDGFVTVVKKENNNFFKKLPTTQFNPQSMFILNNKLFVINSGKSEYKNGTFKPTSPSGIDIFNLNNLDEAETNIEVPIVNNRGSLKSYAICNERLNITGTGLNLYTFDYENLKMMNSTDNPIVIEEENEIKNHLLSLLCIEDHLFIVDGNTDKLYIMDKDNKVILTIEEIDKDNENISMPQKLVHDKKNNKIYIMFGISKKITAIDLNNL